MQIISRVFLLSFLPISLFIYWKLIRKQRGKLWFLYTLSLLFYGLGGFQFIPLLVGLSLITFWAARRNLIWVGVALNLVALGFFKYWDFGAYYIINITRLIKLPILLPILKVALPLGLSYYVFKHVGYLLDVKKGRYPATNDMLTFATFSVFFPQISAGPISSFQDTGQQLRSLPERLSSDNAYRGFFHITIGLAKKMLLADRLSSILALGIYQFDSSGTGLINAWVFVLLQGFRLYLDFSSYSDAALGIGYLFGVTLPANFDNPYLAKTPSSFWEKWHISLSLWFRIYIFSPLSRSLLKRWGSARRMLAQYTANFITMTLIGIWHGANWAIILWGTYHGLLLNIWAWISRNKPQWLDTKFNHVVFFTTFMLGWGAFFSPNLDSLVIITKDLFGLNGLGSLSQIYQRFPQDLLIPLMVAILIALSGSSEAADMIRVRKRWFAVLIGIVFALIIMSTGEPTDFTYVQF
ncbi:MAG: MBOAT family protein [Chloroflexi bacterium]|nr:MBOAT family protein [Chloroflexota bacterium]